MLRLGIRGGGANDIHVMRIEEGVRSGFVDYGGCFCRGGKEARKDENAGKGGWGRGVWKTRRKGGIGIRDEATKT